MEEYVPERVLAVACPSCRVEPGEQCKSKTGRYRSKGDFHAQRKGVVYPSFATKRRGLPDAVRKANNVMEALNVYVGARIGLSQCRTGQEHVEMNQKVAAAREALFDALKDGFT